MLITKTALEQLKQDEIANFFKTDVEQLMAQRSDFYDKNLKKLWLHFGLDNYEDLGLFAVGGYGRREVFPLSDIDLFVIYNDQLSPQAQQNLTNFMQYLWDLNLTLGHKIISFNELSQQAFSDIQVATNLLEARFLIGKEYFPKNIKNSRQYWSSIDFFDAKMLEQQKRYQRYNNTAYNLEPDIKLNPGAIRDLNLLTWILLRDFDEANFSMLRKAQVLTEIEEAALLNNRKFLFRMRFALHLNLNKYDNRLLFANQEKVCEFLGYFEQYDGDKNKALEVMMRHFFCATQQVKTIVETFLSYYKYTQKNINELAVEPFDRYYDLIDQQLELKPSINFTQIPIMDIFNQLVDPKITSDNIGIGAKTMRELVNYIGDIDYNLDQDERERAIFIDFFQYKDVVKRIIRPLHQYGVLSKYSLAFKQITGLMQFDLFHSYTVDEHTLQVMMNIENFQDEPDLYPLCHKIFVNLNLENRRILFIAALLHDIGKGCGGDHSQIGGKIARDFCNLHNMDLTATDLVYFLVENHLVLSTTAQRRDIYNSDEIDIFCQKINSKLHLDLLMCLTVADICGTNRTLWNSWKKNLVTTLYNLSCIALESQAPDAVKDNLCDIGEFNRAKALKSLNFKQGSILEQNLLKFWQDCSDEYFIRNNAKQLAWHAQFLISEDINSLRQTHVLISNIYSRGASEIFIYSPNSKQIFNKIVLVLENKKVSVHDAQIITSNSGCALDSFIITEINGDNLAEERMNEVRQALILALATSKPVQINFRSNYKLKPFKVKTKINFLPPRDDSYSEFELFCLDKSGVLVSISKVFIQLNINILNAKITTVGEKAEDFFIISNQNNKALNLDEQQQLMRLLEYNLSKLN